MDKEWIGNKVSLNCGALGFYQGIIKSIQLDESTITLEEAFQNGLACQRPRITISASDIKELKLLNQGKESSPMKSSAPSENRTPNSVVKVKKKVPRTVVAENLKAASRQQQQRGQQQRGQPQRGQQQSSHRAHNGREGYYSPREYKSQRDEECFSENVINMKEEFDFERNLALFDKRLIFDEIDQQKTTASSSNQPDVVKHNNYRNDESVLNSIPAQYRQINVEERNLKKRSEFVTDSGLIVPTVDKARRDEITATAEAEGVSRERYTDLLARAATDVAIHAIGGAHRLNPSNMHQLPTAVILCSPGRVGSYGLASARMLASHGINTFVYLPCHTINFSIPYKTEWKLYKLTGQKWTHLIENLPKESCKIDIVINALEDDDSYARDRAQPWYKSACQWVDECLEFRTPILSLDPPSKTSCPFRYPAKLTVIPGFLPLDYYAREVGKLYMVNVGIPKTVFTSCGVEYSSPYGAKAALELHRV